MFDDTRMASPMKLDSRAGVANLLNHLAEAAPQMLKKGELELDSTLLSFWLGKELSSELLHALNDLRLELVPRHAEDIQLVNAFWDDLVCEVTANPRIYLEDPLATINLVDEFGDYWKKPLSEFDVIYAIDYLAIGEKPIVLLDMEFFAPTDEALAERGIPKSEIARWSKREGTLTLAAARVEAATSAIAFEAGRRQLAEAIALMQVSTLRGLAGQTSADELLQWKHVWPLSREASYR